MGLAEVGITVQRDFEKSKSRYQSGVSGKMVIYIELVDVVATLQK